MARLYYYTSGVRTGYWRVPKHWDVTFSGVTNYTNCVNRAGGAFIASVKHKAGSVNTTVRLTRTIAALGFCRWANGSSPITGLTHDEYLSAACVDLNGTQTFNSVELLYDSGASLWRLTVAADTVVRFIGTTGSGDPNGSTLACATISNSLTGGSLVDGSAALASGGTATLAAVC